MDRSGPWLEQSFTPVESGPHECRIQVEGVDSQGHRFLRTGIHHFYAEDAVEITQITTRELDEERLAIDLMLTNAIDRPTLLIGSEVWSLGTGGMQPRCWIGGICPVRNGKGDSGSWIVAGSPQRVEARKSLTLRSLRIASPCRSPPLGIGSGRVNSPGRYRCPTGNRSGQLDRPFNATWKRGFEQLQCFTTVVIPTLEIGSIWRPQPHAQPWLLLRCGFMESNGFLG